MVVTDLLSNVFNWTYRLVQHYKTKEEILISNSLLHKTVFGAKQKQQAEEIKALRLESELHNQREHLGRDLHDGLGSQLTHLISRLDLLAYAGSPDPGQLLRLSQFARDMNQTLRETIWLLDQETITIEAFGTRLYGMLLKVWDDRDASELHWELLNTPESPVLSPLTALHLVRITQEGTNNALKYAGATQVKVTLKVCQTQLQLTIQDNGQGFNAATASQGFGLTNMCKRTEEMQGAFDLCTNAAGTCIQLVLPLDK